MAAALVAVLVTAAPAAAKVLLSLDEALALAFPGVSVTRETIYLTETQTTAVAHDVGEPCLSALVVRYLATGAHGRAGTAYVDTHRVRTLSESLLVVLASDGRVARVEVLSFAEPEEYMPRPAWYRLFDGRELDEELRVRRGIRAVTGATLTAVATTAAVRRVLAVHRVIEGGATP